MASEKTRSSKSGLAIMSEGSFEPKSDTEPTSFRSVIVWNDNEDQDAENQG